VPDAAARVVVEAHVLRRSTALAALLHGSKRGPRELRRPYATLVVSVLLGGLLLLGVWAAHRIGALLHRQPQPGRPAHAVTAIHAGRPVGYPDTQWKPPTTAMASGTSDSTATSSTRS
jgi:hypothetical protein